MTSKKIFMRLFYKLKIKKMISNHINKLIINSMRASTSFDKEYCHFLNYHVESFRKYTYIFSVFSKTKTFIHQSLTKKNFEKN